MKYYVISWDTKEVLAEYSTLSAAKKDCRARGYIESRFEGKAPIAFVGTRNDTIICGFPYDLVYNPHFNTLRGE